MKNSTKKELYKTVSLSPFKYLTPSVRTQAYFVVFALIPQLCMLFLTKSFNSLIIVCTSLFASFLAELCDYESLKKGFFAWMIAFIRGVLIGLLLPSNFPLMPIFFITLVVILINRRILGGFATSWINPVAMTVVICWIVGMKLFPSIMLTIDELQTRNPALSLIQNGTFPMLSIDAKITNFLNNKVFGILGVSIPDGYVSIFWDTKSVIPAFRFNFITIISSIVLFAFNIYGLMIPSTFIITYGVLVRVVAPFFYHGPIFQGDVLLALLTSGTLFSTLFLLQWQGTIPLMNRGKFIYGVISGVVAFFIIGTGSSSVGFVFTILIMNVVSPLIQKIENYFEQKYIENVVAKKVKVLSDGVNA